MSTDYEIVKHPSSDRHAVFFENQYVKSFTSKKAAEEWLDARTNPLNYHILANGVVQASFKRKEHRDMLLRVWIDRFSYAEEQFTTKDDL